MATTQNGLNAAASFNYRYIIYDDLPRWRDVVVTRGGTATNVTKDEFRYLQEFYERRLIEQAARRKKDLGDYF